MTADNELTIAVHGWLPPPDVPEPPRRPARWDGRPFPGRCTAPGCLNQATSAVAWWDGGAPGVGTLQRRGHCDEHLGAGDG